MDNTDTFNYTYSAKEQEKIRAIRKKYTAEETREDKLSQLMRLDAAVTQKATTLSLMLGIVGTLILGTGMSLVMTDIGRIIGLTGSAGMAVGILTGIIGIIPVCLAYSVYKRCVRKERAKIAPEIIRLTDELLK